MSVEIFDCLPFKARLTKRGCERNKSLNLCPKQCQGLGTAINRCKKCNAICKQDICDNCKKIMIVEEKKNIDIFFQNKENKRIYLAAPYTHYEDRIRQERVSKTNDVFTRLIQMGFIVFSPLSHTCGIDKRYNLSGSFEFWDKNCLSFLEYWATNLFILKLDGYIHSQGITYEKAKAKEKKLDIIELTLKEFDNFYENNK